MTLGRPVFPFNISDIERKSFHNLGLEIRGSRFPADKYREAFAEWLA